MAINEASLANSQGTKCMEQGTSMKTEAYMVIWDGEADIHKVDIIIVAYDIIFSDVICLGINIIKLLQDGNN